MASRQASLLANPFPAPSRPGECCILHQINQDLLGWCWVEAERITVPFKGDVVGTTRWDEVSSRGRSARRKVPTADGPLPGRGPSFVVWSPWACGAYGQPSSHQRVSSLCSAAPLLPGRNPDLGACPCMLPTGRNPKDTIARREGWVSQRLRLPRNAIWPSAVARATRGDRSAWAREQHEESTTRL